MAVVLQLSVQHVSIEGGTVAEQSCKGQIYYPTSSTKSAFGITRYHYDPPNAMPYDQIAPPEDFDPMTASDEQLVDANFSPRPADSKQLEDWQIEAKRYAGATAIVGGPMCSIADQSEKITESPTKSRSTVVTPQASVGHQTLSNWSGYRDEGNGTGGFFRKVVGHFTQPNVSASSTTAVTNWIGLDGGSNNYTTLLQAGTVTHEGHNDGIVFWEAACGYGTPVCNAAQQPITGSDGYAHPGDDVSMNVNYADGSTSVNVRYQVAINGALIINIEQHYPRYVTSGSRAVFITEKFPSVSLPGFTLIGFNALRTYPTWDSSAGTYWGDQPFRSIILTVGGREATPPCDAVNNSDLIMYPYPVGNTSKTAFYNRQC